MKTAIFNGPQNWPLFWLFRTGTGSHSIDHPMEGMKPEAPETEHHKDDQRISSASIPLRLEIPALRDKDEKH